MRKSFGAVKRGGSRKIKAFAKCAYCQQEFQKWHKQQRCCSKSHAWKFRSENDAQWAQKMNERRRNVYLERIRSEVREAYGTLSPREVELVKLAMRLGYQKRAAIEYRYQQATR
jgi:uncharacterized C2H2 Zn-finger protein